MSSHSPLVLRSVAGIAAEKLKFFIPDYQRGYRWEEDQVKDLLEDLLEFYQSSRPLYCLQPLVVVPKGDQWEVVDGQQRLTTLFLVLSELSREQPGFEIRYERHELPLGDIFLNLDKASDGENSSNPDFHYIREASRQIGAFLTPENRKILAQVSQLSAPKVSFIWYKLPAGDAIAAFTRLNAGKIPLTDVELIRALFLRQDSELNESERLMIATAWDQMEKRLNEDEFWSFAVPVLFEPENRIEVVFDMVAGRRLRQENHELFQYVEGKIRRLGAREAWKETERAFSALDEWYEDHAFFHLVGYLSNAEGIEQAAVWDLYSRYWRSDQVATKDIFKKVLKRIIKDHLLGSQDVRASIDDLEYGDSHIKLILLCVNLASLMNDEHATVRFSFHAFKDQTWDVEHIHAVATEEPTGLDLDELLKMYLDYFERQPSGETAKLLADLKSTFELAAKVDATRKLELYNECKATDEEEDQDEESFNTLRNLTLLDSNTNRGYKNASYKVKRAWILDPDRQHIYVPPSTRSVFTKSYSVEAGELLRWKIQTDGDSYASAMASLLEAFFKEADIIVSSSVGPASPPDDVVRALGNRTVQSQEPQVIRPGETLSFVELVDSYRQIEIPLIQRDYAQGRKSQGAVRSAFLDSIFAFLAKDVGNLNLDFVYGTGDKGKIFHPIDGQQRLTTLFLLHWVAFWKTGKLQAFRSLMSEEGVPRFRYRVRPGAERFFPALLDWQPPSGISGEKWFRDELQRQIWFSRNWLYDPTVKGALVMLDEINEKMRSLSPAQLNAVVERLGSIKMEVLVLPNSISADEIYLKMNARGKPLTDFEKFKAWLVGHHSDLEREYKWKLRLDQQWLEFFWGQAAHGKHRAGTVSACFFNTVFALAINHQAGRHPGASMEKFAAGITAWINLGKDHKVDPWEKLFDEEAIVEVFTSLEGFCRRDDVVHLMQAGDWVSKEKQVISDPDPKLSLPDRCWLHAVTLFCQDKCGDDREWLRVARNLISNTDVRSDIDFVQTIRSLNELAEQMTHGVLQGLVMLEDRDGKTFGPKSFRDQLVEERTKARLLSTQDATWHGIRDAENHGLLRGNIGILLGNPTGGDAPTDAGVFAQRKATFDLMMDRDKMNLLIMANGMDDRRLDRLIILAVLARCEAIGGNEVWLPKITGPGWGATLKRDADTKELQGGLLRVIDELIGSASHGRPDLLVERLDQISSSPPDSLPPWMKNLIRHGEAILIGSKEWKLKSYHYWHYHEKAYFAYHKVNTHDLDVLIGDEFHIRNELLTKLIAAGWALSEAREIISGGRKIFSGHHPELRREGRKMTFFYQCIVCDQLDDAGSNRRIPFMTGDQPREIQHILDELTQLGVATNTDGITAADDFEENHLAEPVAFR